MSTRPNFSRQAATTWVHWASLVRSAGAYAARPPWAEISAEVAASSFSVRAVRKTAAPSFAKRRAMARPMPRPEPVIRATRYRSSIEETRIEGSRKGGKPGGAKLDVWSALLAGQQLYLRSGVI